MKNTLKLIIFLLAVVTNCYVKGQTWKKLNLFPSTGRYAKTFVINNEGYIVGGLTSAGATNECWKYVLQKDSWKQMSKLPISGSYFNTFTIGSIGYAFYDSALFAYNPVSNIWVKKKGLYNGVSSFSNSPVFVINNLAYMLGSDKKVYSYDPTSNTWTRKSDFPGLGRSAHVAFSIKNKGYIALGLNSTSAGNKTLNDMWEYDPGSDKWSQKSNFPSTARYTTFCCSDGVVAYLIGGELLSPSATASRDMYSYDPSNDKFTKMSDFMGGDRNYVGGFFINNSIYCGFGGFGYYRDFYKFDVTVNTNNNCDLISKVCVSVNPKSESKIYASIPNGRIKKTNPVVDLPKNVWTHLAVVKRDSFVYVYKNGVLYDSNVYTKQTYTWSKLVLGAVLFGGKYNQPFKGWIDDLRYSDQYRTSSEILNNYNSSSPTVADAKTIGIWNFDTLNAKTGNFGGKYGGIGGVATNVSLSSGKFGNAFYYNGINSHSDIGRSININNYTTEFWIKPDSMMDAWPICYYGFNTDGLLISNKTSYVKYKWSTGDTGLSTCVNPNSISYVTVTDGNCIDTIYLAWDKSHITIYDSIRITVRDTMKIAVTDTLYVNVKFSTTVGSKINTVKIYPNPTNSVLNFDFNNYNDIFGYTITIENLSGQLVYSKTITNPSETVDLSTFLSKGIYYVKIKDKSGQLAADIKKIILR